MFGRNKHKPANPVRLVKDASGAPAVDLNKLEQHGHSKAVSLAKTVGVSLQKRNLAGMRGRVVVIVDHSGSMSSDFASGAVQKLLELTFGFGLQIDTDGSIEVFTFDFKANETQTVDINNYQSAAQDIWNRHNMGSTNMVSALEKLRDMAKDTKEVIVAVVIGDGAPNDMNYSGDAPDTTKVVCDLARYPVFLKFLALRNVPFLDKLNHLEKTQPGARILDNVNSQTIDPDKITPEQFAEKMVEEWDEWLSAALNAGVLHQ